MMDVYKRLRRNKCHNTVAKDLGISPAHVGRIADFLVEEYFLVPEVFKSKVKLYVKTKRIPTPKILFDIITNKQHDEGGSLICGVHNLQYRSNLTSDISPKVIISCKEISPKGTKKYLFPPNKNLKLAFNLIIHDGKYRKSVMFYLNRIHLTVSELSISDEILDERIRRIAYNVQYFFKIKIDLPKPVGKKYEYAFVPKEKFLVDTLEEITFEINSRVGTIKGDASGNPLVLNGKEIEFDNKNLAMTYVKIIPFTHMLGLTVEDHRGRIENLEHEVIEIKGMISETKPMLERIIIYINNEEKLREQYAKRTPSNLDNSSYG
jgi:hypothetical protein